MYAKTYKLSLCILTCVLIPQIVTRVSSLLTQLRGLSDTTSDGTDLRLCVSALYYTEPLLHKYLLGVEHQLGCSVLLHRSMGKLLSVLLAVFTELAGKVGHLFLIFLANIQPRV